MQHRRILQNYVLVCAPDKDELRRIGVVFVLNYKVTLVVAGQLQFECGGFILQRFWRMSTSMAHLERQDFPIELGVKQRLWNSGDCGHWLSGVAPVQVKQNRTRGTSRLIRVGHRCASISVSFREDELSMYLFDSAATKDFV